MNELTLLEWVIGITAPYICCVGVLFVIGGALAFVGSLRRNGVRW